MTVLYWHWIVLGLLLMAAELAIPSFTIFWFGLGAFPVAVLLYFAPHTQLGSQIAVWTAASVLCTIAWFRYLKPRMENRTLAGMSREAIVGQIGTVITAPLEGGRGLLRFAVPIVGRQEWSFLCGEEAVGAGERVIVQDVSGNTLIVTKQNKGA